MTTIVTGSVAKHTKNALAPSNFANSPIMVLCQIEDKLRQAEDALLNGDLDSAKKRKDEASQFRDASVGQSPESAIAALREALDKGLQWLAANPLPVERGEKVISFIRQLQESAERITTMDMSALLDVEWDYNVAHTYVNVGERALARNPGDQHFKAAADLLFALLKANPASPQAAQLALLIDSDLTPADLDQAVTEKSGHIECNTSHPRLHELNDYWFEFTDPRIASVPVALRLLKFSWDFGDNTSPPHYDHCKHFYTKRKDYGEGAQTEVARSFSLANTWRSPLSVLPQSPKQTDLTIKVTVTAPSGHQETFTRPITLAVSGNRGHGVIGMQILSFAVTSLVALLAAFGTQYSKAPEALTLSAALPAFLLGFGLDQLRSKTAVRS